MAGVDYTTKSIDSFLYYTDWLSLLLTRSTPGGSAICITEPAPSM